MGPNGNGDQGRYAFDLIFSLVGGGGSFQLAILTAGVLSRRLARLKGFHACASPAGQLLARDPAPVCRQPRVTGRAACLDAREMNTAKGEGGCYALCETHRK